LIGINLIYTRKPSLKKYGIWNLKSPRIERWLIKKGSRKKKSRGDFEETINHVLKRHADNPSDWEGLGKSWKIALMIGAPFISIEQEIKNLEIGIAKTFDRRDQLRAEEIRLEKLKRRYKKVMYKIRKLDDFQDKEYKKLRQERNENLISLFDSIQ